MKKSKESKGNRLSRRSFIGSVAAAGAAAIGSGKLQAQDKEKPKPRPKRPDPDKVNTNIADAAKVPRAEGAMPGKFPGVVSEVFHPAAVSGSKPDQEIAKAMLATAMISLTGKEDEKGAWKEFFSPEDRIGIKINPVAGKLLCNSHEMTHAIIDSLVEIGVPKSNIVLWDRREEQMKDCGFTEENYPGIKCIGTEYMIKDGEKEIWKGEDRLDKNHFYEFDIVGEYTEEVMPYMIHGGTKSYYTNILTQMVDKVINVPILKNAGRSVTLAMKNLAYGVTSNTMRGHKIWSRYIAEVCAFAPVRDKVVLNIIDGLRGCYEGGPGAVARYIWNANTVWIGTDPVAVDRVAWEKIFAKRVAEGIAAEEDRATKDRDLDQLVRSEKLGLGTYDRAKIDHRRTKLSEKEKA